MRPSVCAGVGESGASAFSWGPRVSRPWPGALRQPSRRLGTCPDEAADVCAAASAWRARPAQAALGQLPSRPSATLGDSRGLPQPTALRPLRSWSGAQQSYRPQWPGLRPFVRQVGHHRAPPRGRPFACPAAGGPSDAFGTLPRTPPGARGWARRPAVQSLRPFVPPPRRRSRRCQCRLAPWALGRTSGAGAGAFCGAFAARAAAFRDLPSLPGRSCPPRPRRPRGKAAIRRLRR